jgi:hypothetical protein
VMLGEGASRLMRRACSTSCRQAVNASSRVEPVAS